MKVFLAVLALAFFAAVPELRAEGAAPLPPPSLEKIADGVWIHKSYESLPKYGLILSQGLVIDRGDGLLLVDTAWTDEETEALLRLIKRETGKKSALAVVTHAHNDKMGGMKTLRAAGVATRAHPLTNEDAPARGLLSADGTILDGRDDEMIAGSVEVFYPGPGHTRDNIVVYYAPAKVLFGGCLIRPGAANNLGNTADGDVQNWANAVRKVAARFPDAEIVIPSHGPKGGRELLDHTIALAEAAVRE